MTPEEEHSLHDGMVCQSFYMIADVAMAQNHQGLLEKKILHFHSVIQNVHRFIVHLRNYRQTGFQLFLRMNAHFS